jgi:uncharacterized protein involved in exopolysaccharide biosynthesis
VVRYRYLVGALTAIGTFAGIMASSMIPTEYQARTALAVDTAAEAAIVSGPIRSSALLEPEAWTSGLVSYGIIQGILGDSAVTGPRGSVEDLASRFEADVDAEQSFVRLTLADENPERASTVLNAAAGRFIDLALELKIENRRELAEDLAQRRAYATESLTLTEAALVESRRVIQASPRERAARRTLRLEAARDTAVASFFDRRVELEQVTRDRETLEALLEASRDSSLVVEPVQVIASARGSSELTAALEDMYAKRAELRVLRNHYTDEHPRVQQLADELAVLERGPALDVGAVQDVEDAGKRDVRGTDRGPCRAQGDAAARHRGSATRAAGAGPRGLLGDASASLRRSRGGRRQQLFRSQYHRTGCRS